ncbi:MAG: hypothetical protein WBP16_01760 [Ferruginibacter sp.]
MNNNSNITDHTTLTQRIVQLREDKKIQEEELKQSVNTALSTLNPLIMLKQSLHEFVQDKEVKSDIVKAGLNLGANLVIDKSLGKYKSIKGFLSSVLVESISTPLIYSGLAKLFPNLIKEDAPEAEEALNE